MDQLGGFVSTPPRSTTPASAPGTTATAAAGTSSDSQSTQTTMPASSSSGGPATEAAKPRGLDDEVATLVGGFTSFWGRVKKQSVAALHEAEKQYETARADLSPLLNQAKTQLDHLSEQTRAELQRLAETPAAPSEGADVIIGPDGIPIVLEQQQPRQQSAPTKREEDVAPPREEGDGEAASSDKGKGVDRADDTSLPNEAATQQQTPAAAASAFFSKWQTQLASNPNVKDFSRNLTSIQSNLSTNLHQIQEQLTHLDLTEGQKVADRYLHKGEAWFQEFSAEVAHLAKEAVKVVPPTGPGSTTARSGFERAGTPVMTRRDMILHKLRTDSAQLLIDPAQPPAASAASTTDLSSSTSIPDTREAYAAYLTSLQEKGGFESDALRADVERELLEGGEALETTRNELVPSQIPEEVFWTRYFFRKQGIEEEEERRKKVLQVAQQDDDDFSWDMDDEESVASPRAPQEPAMAAAPVPPLASAPTTAPESFDSLPDAPVHKVEHAAAPAAATSIPSVSADTSPIASDDRSPRASSDGTSSFDIIGEKSGNPSADEHERGSAGASSSKKAGDTAAPGAQQSAAVDAKKDEEEDEDSDWE